MGIPELHWSTQLAYPILTSIQLLPLIAILATLVLRNSRVLLATGILFALAELVLTINLYYALEGKTAGLQLSERFVLLHPLVYHAAVDGISVLFMLMTSVLTLLIVLYAHARKVEHLAKFLAFVFAIEASLQSLFCTQDILWFTLASAAEIILIAYVLKHWANAPKEELALHRYLQFMGTGLLLLFLGVFILGWNYAELHNGVWSFELHNLMGQPLPETLSVAIFFLLFYGLAIRIPLFPLHGWLPLIAEHGTVAVAGVFLLGLKTGIYGLLRFVFPLVPDAVKAWNEWVIAFAVIGIFYAALLALMQTNMRRLLAFAVVSHTSVVVIGLFTLNNLGFQGGIMLSVNFGLATAGLLFMTGFIYRRTRTLSLPRLGNLFDQFPVIGTAFLIAGLSIIGMPGTPGFDAAHLMMEASIQRFGALVTIAAALGNVAAAGFLLWSFQRAFLTPPAIEPKTRKLEPATLMERVMAIAVIVMLLGVGFYSEPWLKLIESSLGGLNAIYSGTEIPADGIVPQHSID
ncbi:MAG: NADH-quinone oxidoreductase subunit M [Gammaproteobacteria bacterium]